MVTVEEPTGKFSKRGKNAGKPITRTKRVPRGCGSRIVLWESGVDHENGEVKKTFNCSSCGQSWSKGQLERTDLQSVLSCYEVETLFDSPSKRSKNTIRLTRPTTCREIGRLSEIAAEKIAYRYPDQTIDMGREMMRHGGLKRGPASIDDFYTRRNLRALSRLWYEITTNSPKELLPALRFAFTGIAVTSSKLNAHHFGGQARPRVGTLFIPSLIEDANPLRLLNGKTKSQPRVFQFLKRFASRPTPVVANFDACCIPAPDASVDYVFADPPFGSNIFYSDCSLLWESWLGQFTPESLEIVVNDRREGGPFKHLNDYQRLMTLAFREIHRALKPGRYATIEFNNRDGAVFEAIKCAAREAGFEIENMIFLDKIHKTFKQIKGAKGEEDVVGYDVIFNLRKPHPVANRAAQSDSQSDLIRSVAESVAEHLRTLPDRIANDAATYTDEHRTTPFLNTMLMNTLIPRGVNVSQLSLPFIEQVCVRYFRRIEGRWYLRNEAIGTENGKGMLIEHEVEISDEVSAIAWLRQQLQERPMMIGEIKPLWFKATAKLAGNLSTQLERLLRQNFWHDRATNRYSEPTSEQRGLMDTTEREAALHDAERFLAGSLNRSVSDAEVCLWIGYLYAAASAVEEAVGHQTENGGPHRLPDESRSLYDQMARLFQGVLKEKVESKLYASAARQVRTASAKLRTDTEARRDLEDAVPTADDEQGRLF